MAKIKGIWNLKARLTPPLSQINQTGLDARMPVAIDGSIHMMFVSALYIMPKAAGTEIFATFTSVAPPFPSEITQETSGQLKIYDDEISYGEEWGGWAPFEGLDPDINRVLAGISFNDNDSANNVSEDFMKFMIDNAYQESYSIGSKTLTDIANAIRAKKGTEDPIKPRDFAAEIEALTIGGGSGFYTTKENEAGGITYNFTAEESEGGGGYIDVTELPTEDINEDVVYRLTEEKETPVMLWVTAYTDGTEFNMPLADLIAMTGVESNITINIVETLPETMGCTNPQFNFPCYVLESTGIAYVSGDGTQATVTTLSAELFGGEAIDRGWVDSVDDIVIDTSTNNMNLYTIRPGTQLVPKGLFTYSDGWYELEKTLETTEKPREPRVYVTTGGKAVDWLVHLGNSEDNVQFVDAIPLDTDGVYVLNANGFVYAVSNGKAVEFTEILSGTNCGWVDSIEEMDVSQDNRLYALRGSKTDVIYKVGENGTTNEVYIHENDEWQGFVKDVPEGGEKCVNFYDYDGTLLHSYTIAEAQALTELPELPTQPGLVCQGWNYDLATIKDYNSPLDVGALYITDDGKTRIYIKIPLDNYKFSIYFSQSTKNQAVFDWGDGTETSSSTNTTSCAVDHTYAKAGDYVIAIENTDKNNVVQFGATKNYSAFGGTAPSSSYASIANNALVEKIECGFEFAAFSDAFSFCTSLKTITIPNPNREFYTAIMSNAFYNCYSLKHITFPKGTSQVNSYAFQSCYNLKSVSCPNKMNFGQGSFAFCQKLPRFVLPKASTMGQGMFSSCTSLKDIYASEIETIAQSIISSLNSLEKFTIPEGCTKIAAQAFNYSQISKITIPSSVEKFGTGVFSSCYSLEEVEGYTKSQFVQKDTFNGCYSLKNITIPEGTTEIPQNFFNSCYSLESVTIPSSVAIVRQNALSNCARLLSIVFLGNVTLIEAYAFQHCQGVRYYDFTHCTAVPTLSSTGAFNYIPSDCEIRVPAALYDEWKAATNWSSYARYIVGV